MAIRSKRMPSRRRLVQALASNFHRRGEAALRRNPAQLTSSIHAI
jgi:hypothetical protein